MSRHTFNPTDDELINRYLNNKITETDDLGAGGEINEVNICHHEPADIPSLARMESSHTWHIISRVEKLKGRLKRNKRSSKTGHWEVKGKSCMVKDIGGNVIGSKKYLVFQENKRYSSSPSSSSTSIQQNKWIIHEFHSDIQHPNKDAFVLCKLMKKTTTPRSDAVADAPPVARVLPPILTAVPIISHSQAQNDNILVEDYGGDYCDSLEDIFPGFQSIDLPDQPQYYHYDYSQVSHHSADTPMLDFELEENWEDNLRFTGL